MEPATSINCLNCNTPLQGVYCHKCGQRLRKEKLTLKFLLKDFFYNVTDLEKGLLFTTKELLIRPGKVVKEFLAGKTVIYSNPFKFLFTMATLSAIFIVFLDFNEISRDVNLNQENASTQNLNAQLFKWISDYFSLITIFFAPIYALVSKVVYRRSDFNLGDHFVIASYFTGITAVFTTFITLIIIIVPGLEPHYFSLGAITYIYLVFAYYQTFKTKGFKGVILPLLTILLFFFTFFVISIIGSILWVKIFNPDILLQGVK